MDQGAVILTGITKKRVIEGIQITLKHFKSQSDSLYQCLIT